VLRLLPTIRVPAETAAGSVDVRVFSTDKQTTVALFRISKNLSVYSKALSRT
jgi:hypothetical protein